MGKHILVQRHGRAQFKILGHRRRQPIKYRSVPEGDKKSVKGKIIDIVHETARGTPLVEVLYEDGLKRFELPPEGVAVGDMIEIGAKVPLKVGNTMKLANIEDGAIVYNLELHPGDGGKMVRGSGTFATIVSRMGNHINVSLPSGELKVFSPECRATIGVVSGGGREMKPLMKAGVAFYLNRAKGHHRWPRVRSNMMCAVSHPFGGGYKAKRPKTTSRNAPPGRKVGLIAARRTGVRKK